MSARRLSQQVAISWSSLIFKPGLTKRSIHTIPFLYSDTCYSSNRELPFRHLPKCHFFTSQEAASRAVHELLPEVEKEKQREREARRRAGLDTKDINAEDEEDYMGVGPLIQKLEKEKLKLEASADLDLFEEPTDSESDDDDERYSPNNIKKRFKQFEKKFKRLHELVKNYVESDTLADENKWISRILRFEDKHFMLPPEYEVIKLLMNSVTTGEGKKKFILQQQLYRLTRLVAWKDAYDPYNPANYGVIQHEQAGLRLVNDLLDQAGFEKERQAIQGVDDDDDEEFDDMKEKDDMFIEQINEIDKKLEEKLAQVDHTFGKKGKVLEEEIRDLAKERNALTEKKRRHLYRKGFDVKWIDVNRTCKVTMSGLVMKYTAMLACGNYHGVVGFAKAKHPAFQIAVLKAYEKCFQNLHFVERHEEHTIAHAVQTTYKKTKVHLWPASTRTGMKVGRTVQTILNLAGFKKVKSKVIGSRNPHNIVKALFKALNAIETPKDVQEELWKNARMYEVSAERYSQ